MTGDELDRVLERAAREYNPPPDTPRDEMWAAIRAGLTERDRRGMSALASQDFDARRARRARVDRLKRWTPWAVGLATAATLAAGFGLGRVTRDGAVAPPPPGRAAETTNERPSRPVGVAAAAHLGEAEALLTLFRTSEQPADRAATAAWARELLMTTRLMLDARAAEDAAMAQLLADLEVVLVQIVNAAAVDDGMLPEEEQALIEEGIEQRELMTKLRSAGGALAGLTL